MTLRRIFMEVQDLSIFCGRRWIDASFTEEQERLHSTIPMSNAKQIKSNKKVRLTTFSFQNTKLNPQF